MYTQYQRCIATILLFSIFLQSCGNPHWKMVEPVGPGASGKGSKPAKINQRTPAKLLLKQEDAHELHGELSHGEFDASSSSSCDEPSSTSVVLTPSQRRAPSSLARSSKPLTESRQAISAKNYRDQLRHRRRDKALPSGRVGSVGAQAPATPTLSPLPPVSQRSQQATLVARKPTTQARLMVPYASLPNNPVTPSYPSAQGHQVRFQQQFGAWMAEVQDGWGRTQRLPVICGPEQEPEQAIQQLSSKSLGQHKYWVHVLEAHQPPWSPRVVYVGALGLRGGGNSSSSDSGRSSYTNLCNECGHPSNFVSDERGTRYQCINRNCPLGPLGSNQSHSQSSTRGSSAAFHGSGRSSPQSNSSNAWSGSYRPASSPTSQSFYRGDYSWEDKEIQRYNQIVSEAHDELQTVSLSTLDEVNHRKQRLEYYLSELQKINPRDLLTEKRKDELQHNLRVLQRGCEELCDIKNRLEEEEAWERERERERRAQEAWEREREQERRAQEEREREQKRRAQEAWERERERKRRAQEEQEAWEREREREQRAIVEELSKQAYFRWKEQELSKQAYFRWKEQEEIRNANKAEELARQIYLSRWKKQEEFRRAEERKKRLDETHHREEQRRRQETEDHKMPATPAAAMPNTHTASAAQAPAAHAQTEAEEDHKMPSLPRVTTFSTPEEAQAAVETYLERWRLETPAGRATLKKQSQAILEGVAALEQMTESSYCQQVLGFETKDIDPLVWEHVLREQEATLSQLNVLINLRGQLLHTLPLQVTVATHPIQRDNAEGQAQVSSLPQAMCESIVSYYQACEADEAFRYQHIVLTILEAQLKHDPTNDDLARQWQAQEAAFQQHPLYQEGVQLALEAQKLREDELDKETGIIISEAEMRMGMDAAKLSQSALHRKEAETIREKLLQPVRKLLKRSSTPPRMQRIGQAVMGVGENAVDTVENVVDIVKLAVNSSLKNVELAVNLPFLAAKLLGGVEYSLATWEDHLGIGEKITDASELINAFCNKMKYEWENSEEYQERLKTAQAYRAKLLLAERALNAEAYHNKNAREMGYWSAEALQWVFGEKIIEKAVKMAVKSSKTAKKAAKIINRTVDAGSVLEMSGVSMDALGEDEEVKKDH